MLSFDTDIDQLMRFINEKTHLEYAENEAILAEEMGVTEADTFDLIHALEHEQIPEEADQP
jgi:predicted nucleotidyltransferase